MLKCEEKTKTTLWIKNENILVFLDLYKDSFIVKVKKGQNHIYLLLDTNDNHIEEPYNYFSNRLFSSFIVEKLIEYSNGSLKYRLIEGDEGIELTGLERLQKMGNYFHMDFSLPQNISWKIIDIKKPPSSFIYWKVNLEPFRISKKLFKQIIKGELL